MCLAIYTIELHEIDKQKLNSYPGIHIEDESFIFHSTDNTVKFALVWFEESKELWGAMAIYDPKTQQTILYEGYEQLSHPEPSKYIACIFNKCFEIVTGDRFCGTTTTIQQEYIIPTSQEWRDAMVKLFDE